MRTRQMAADISIGLLAGYVGTKIMEPVSMKLYELESKADREQEDRVRPGSPYRLAAEKMTKAVGLHLADKELDRAGMAFHYGLGMSWGPAYTLLRRAVRINPLVAGSLVGGAMWLLADELMTPAFGFSAPNTAYPISTHVRGFIAHIVFGLGVAAAAECCYAVGSAGGTRVRESRRPGLSLHKIRESVWIRRFSCP